MFTGDKNPFYDKKHTNESKEKMSNAVKKSFSNIEIIEKLSTIKNKIKRPLYQFDMNGNFIKEWDSVSRIKRELNFDRKTIKQVCNGVYKQAYGFIWKYKN
jgi:predicted AAA+ superfamily ATPase